MRRCTLLLFIAVPFLYSCNSPRYIYSPSPPNNPYFKEKGETKLTAYYSGNEGTTSGYDLQTAYAISEKWALTSSFTRRKEEDEYDQYNNYFNFSDIKYKRNLTELGGGYFIPMDKAKSIFFAVYGGLGFGKFSFYDAGRDKANAKYERQYSSRMAKWYFQPSFNIMRGKYFRVGFIGKFSFARYHHISTSYLPEEMDYFDLDKVPGETFSFFEPTFNLQIGLSEWLKIDGCFGFSSSPYKSAANIESRNFNGAIGLSFDFSRIKARSNNHQ